MCVAKRIFGWINFDVTNYFTYNIWPSSFSFYTTIRRDTPKQKVTTVKKFIFYVREFVRISTLSQASPVVLIYFDTLFSISLYFFKICLWHKRIRSRKGLHVCLLYFPDSWNSMKIYHRSVWFHQKWYINKKSSPIIWMSLLVVDFFYGFFLVCLTEIKSIGNNKFC